MIFLLTLALAAVQAPAMERPAGQPITPAAVCLTNACSNPLNKPRDPAAVQSAVRAGNYGRILAAGGDAEDVMAGAKVRCRTNPQAAQLRVCGEVEPGSARLDTREGMISLTWTPKGADGSRPGDVTKVEMVLTAEEESPDREITDQVLPPPPRR